MTTTKETKKPKPKPKAMAAFYGKVIRAGEETGWRTPRQWKGNPDFRPASMDFEKYILVSEGEYVGMWHFRRGMATGGILTYAYYDFFEVNKELDEFLNHQYTNLRISREQHLEHYLQWSRLIQREMGTERSKLYDITLPDHIAELERLVKQEKASRIPSHQNEDERYLISNAEWEQRSFQKPEMGMRAIVFAERAGIKPEELIMLLKAVPLRGNSLKAAISYCWKFTSHKDRVRFSKKFFETWSVNKSMPRWIKQIQKWKTLLDGPMFNGLRLDELRVLAPKWLNAFPNLHGFDHPHCGLDTMWSTRGFAKVLRASVQEEAQRRQPHGLRCKYNLTQKREIMMEMSRGYKALRLHKSRESYGNYWRGRGERVPEISDVQIALARSYFSSGIDCFNMFGELERELYEHVDPREEFLAQVEAACTAKRWFTALDSNELDLPCNQPPYLPEVSPMSREESNLILFRYHDTLSHALNNLTAEADELQQRLRDGEKAEAYDRAQEFHQTCPFEPEWIGILPVHNTTPSNGYEVLIQYKQLISWTDFANESKDMHHCIRSYFKNHQECYYCSVTVSRDGFRDKRSSVMFELDLVTTHLYENDVHQGDKITYSVKILQHLGFGNAEPAEYEIQAVRQMFELWNEGHPFPNVVS